MAVPGEEDGGTGTLSAIRRGWTGDHVIITEPSSAGAGPEIVVAHGGALTFSIDVPGRSAHGSTPHEGVSALDMFIAVRDVIATLERDVNDAETDDRMRSLGVPYPTSIGIVRGGTWASNVMESLHAEARVGVALGESIAEAERRFRTGVLRGAAEAAPWLAAHPPTVARTGAAFGSSAIADDHQLVTGLRAAAARTTGRNPALVAVPYGCDMAMWTNVGKAAALVYGPGNVRQAHAPDEYVSLDETVAVAETLKAHMGEEAQR